MILNKNIQPAAPQSPVPTTSESLTPEPMNSVSRSLRSFLLRTNASFMYTSAAFMSTNASLIRTNAARPLVSQRTRPRSDTLFASTRDAFMSTNASLALASHRIEPQSLRRCRPCQHQLNRPESIKTKISQYKKHNSTRFLPRCFHVPCFDVPEAGTQIADRPCLDQACYPQRRTRNVECRSCCRACQHKQSPKESNTSEIAALQKTQIPPRTGFCVRSTLPPGRSVPPNPPCTSRIQ